MEFSGKSMTAGSIAAGRAKAAPDLLACAPPPPNRLVVASPAPNRRYEAVVRNIMVTLRDYLQGLAAR